MIIYLQNLANQLPYTFIDKKKVTKSHILIANILIRIDVLVGQLTNKFEICLECGRPTNLKDVIPQKQKKHKENLTL